MGLAGEPLACDVAVLGPERAARAAIAITGTHGVEGYAGSAVLHRWLTDRGTAARRHQDRAGARHQSLGVLAQDPHHREQCRSEPQLHPRQRRLRARRTPAMIHWRRSSTSIRPTRAAPSTRTAATRRTSIAMAGISRTRCWKASAIGPMACSMPARNRNGPTCCSGASSREHLGAARTIGFVDWHTGVGSFGEIVYLIFDEPGSAEHAAAARWWNRELEEKSAFKSGSTPKYRGLLCQAIRAGAARCAHRRRGGRVRHRR